MIKTLNKKKLLAYLLMFAGISLVVTLINLGLTKDYFGDDVGMSYYFPHLLSKLSILTWDSYIAPGKINVTSLINIIWYYPLYWLSLLHIGGFFLGRLLFFLFLFLSGYGMFMLSLYLIKYFQPNVTEELLYPSSLISGLFFMLNYYSLQMTLIPIMPYHITYMLFPWLFLLFLLNLEDHFSLIKMLLFTLLLLFCLTGNFSNFFSTSIFLLFFIFVFVKKIHQRTLKQFFSIGILLFTLLTCFIWLPIFGIGENPYGFSKLINNFLDSLNYNSHFTSVSNIMRLMGSVASPYAAYFDGYINNPLIMITSFVIPIITVCFLIYLIKNRFIIFLSIVLVISIFFAKGTQPPFKQIIIYLFTYVPFFEMYRSVYLKFSYFIVFCYSLILSHGLSIFFIQKSKRVFYLCVALLSIVILINAYPFFIGEAIKKDYLTNIPKEYLTIDRVISDKDTGKVVSFPPTPQGGGPLLNWGIGNRYNGPHQDYLFLNRPVFDSYWFIKNNFYDLNLNDSWDGNRFEKKIDKLIDKFGAFNIRYILLHKDFDNGFYSGDMLLKKIDAALKTETAIKQLSNNNDVHLLKETKYFNLYKISDSTYLEQFYIPDKLIFSSNPLYELLNNPNLAIKNQSRIAIIPFDIGNLTKSEVKPIINVSKDKKNLNQFNIEIKNAPGDFVLVFSESYNNNWLLKSDIFSINNHFIANGYSNGWKITPKQLCPKNQQNIKGCSGTLTLTFFPQNLFVIGSAVCILTLIICLLISLYQFLTNKK